MHAGTVVAVAHGLIHEVAGELEGVQQAQSCLEVLDGGLLPGIANLLQRREFLVDETGEVGDVAQLLVGGHLVVEFGLYLFHKRFLGIVAVTKVHSLYLILGRKPPSLLETRGTIKTNLNQNAYETF